MAVYVEKKNIDCSKRGKVLSEYLYKFLDRNQVASSPSPIVKVHGSMCLQFSKQQSTMVHVTSKALKNSLQIQDEMADAQDSQERINCSQLPCQPLEKEHVHCIEPWHEMNLTP